MYLPCFTTLLRTTLLPNPPVCMTPSGQTPQATATSAAYLTPHYPRVNVHNHRCFRQHNKICAKIMYNLAQQMTELICCSADRLIILYATNLQGYDIAHQCVRTHRWVQTEDDTTTCRLSGTETVVHVVLHCPALAAKVWPALLFFLAGLGLN